MHRRWSLRLRRRSTAQRYHATTASATPDEESSGYIEWALPPQSVTARAWTRGVHVDPHAQKQVLDLASLSSIVRHPVAVMPDVHAGVSTGGTVGTVVPTYRAIIPSSVGVDIGCGMLAVKTSLCESDLPKNGGDLAALRIAIEEAVPHGRTHNGDAANDAGGWRHQVPSRVASIWKSRLEARFHAICARRPMLERANHVNHLGTLGTGNHFVEVCVETAVEDDDTSKASSLSSSAGRPIWFMLHSGSRGVGNRIGMTYIQLAQQDMGKLISGLPHADLAYFNEGTEHFDEYIQAVQWAQDFAKWNRELMMSNIIDAVKSSGLITKPFCASQVAVNCHHNYVEKYHLPPTHPGCGSPSRSKALSDCEDYVWLTRKGATSAKLGELAVIPGSMGAKSYIVRGKGNPLSYESCSHGAGRKHSRGESTRRFTLAEHEAATVGVECRKDAGVLDETPAAYKPIDDVMRAQSDLVEIVYTLKQIICVKG